MHVFLLITQMEAGGAQKAMLLLASGLVDQGHEVTIAAMYDKDQYIQLFENAYNLKIHDLEMKLVNQDSGKLFNVWYIIRGLLRLFFLMRQTKADILQTFTYYSNIIGPIVGWFARVPIRISSQRLVMKNRSKSFLILDRIIVNSPFVHRMTAVSARTRQFCIQEEGMEPGKVTTIRNGIDLGQFQIQKQINREQIIDSSRIKNSTFLAATVARLHPQKGHVYLLQAIFEIVKEIQDIHFLFVGDGPISSDLTNLISNLQLNDYVNMTGMYPDVLNILAVSDVFVLPSIYEGLPNSVMEAMAAGVPVIATDVGGTLELIEDGKDGILVQPADPAALADAITTLYYDHDLGQRLAKSAREKIVTDFSQENVTSRYIDLYMDLMSKSQS